MTNKDLLKRETKRGQACDIAIWLDGGNGENKIGASWAGSRELKSKVGL